MMSLQSEPIDITKKQPAFGQRCNVFETRNNRQWMYAYWCRDPMTGEFYFEEWHAGIPKRIEASHWMPELEKPKPKPICRICSDEHIVLTETFLKALSALGYDDPVAMKAGWILEREATILELRDLCGEFGDNDWDENLSLADVVGKHLGRHLYSKVGSADDE